MHQQNNGYPSFVVVILCRGASIGDVISALRNRQMVALETIHIEDIGKHPIRHQDHPCLFVFGQNRTLLTQDEAGFRQALQEC